MAGNTKKRGSIATRIYLLVIIIVLLSNVICLTLVVSRTKGQIERVVQNSMLDMAESYSTLVDDMMGNADDLTYDEYAGILADVKVKGMDSSYVYVVSADGIMVFHPTQDKVGNPVENSVVKGLVAELQAGKHPAADVVTYEYKGANKYASYELLCNDNILVVTADEKDALSAIQQTTNSAILIAVIILIISVVVSFLYGKKLASPLVKLSGIVEEVAGGNMKADFSGVKITNDEIGLMAISIKQMTESLDAIVDKIRATSDAMTHHSEELNTTSEQTLAANSEISKAVEDVAEGSTSMATSISDISDNLGTMSSETSTIDSSVVDIREQTRAVQASSASMSEKMRHMKESSVKMDEGIATISDRIQKVNSVVDKVSDIISVIEGISGQTNLLSLNASIEAARAGEAGRGFAVVAEEIRVLSDNTNSELNNIKAIISELVKECEECVSASDAVVSDNAEQKEEIESVLTEFVNLDQQIGMTAEKAEEIRELVDEMVSLNTSITQSSDGLTDVSTANASATEQMTANIQELNAMMHGVADMAGQMRDQSNALNDALGYFK